MYHAAVFILMIVYFIAVGGELKHALEGDFTLGKHTASIQVAQK